MSLIGAALTLALCAMGASLAGCHRHSQAPTARARLASLNPASQRRQTRKGRSANINTGVEDHGDDNDH